LDREACSDRHERARSGVGFKETDATTGQRVHSTGTTLASRSIFAPPSIHSSLLLLPLFHFHSCISLPSPHFLFPPPVRLSFGLCILPPPLVYGQEAREGERWVQREREEGTSEEMERHCSRVLTSGSAPLQLLDVFNSSLCLLSRHGGGLLKQQPQVATFSTRLGLGQTSAWRETQKHTLISV